MNELQIFLSQNFHLIKYSSCRGQFTPLEQSEHCDDVSDIGLIEKNGVAPKWDGFHCFQ